MGKLSYFDALRYISRYAKKYVKYWIKYFIGWLIINVFGVVSPILFGSMIDEIVYYKHLGTFLTISLIFVLVSLFCCFLYFLLYAQEHYLRNMFSYDIKMDIFKKIQRCDAEYLTGIQSGDLINTIQWYPEESMDFIMTSIDFINGIITLTVFSIYIFIISWKIGLLILVALPLSILVNNRFGNRVNKYEKRRKSLFADYISWIMEMISGLRDIRMLGAEDKTRRSFKERHRALYDLSIRSGLSSMFAGDITGFITLSIQLAIYVFAGFQAARGDLTIGLLTVILAFYESISGSVGGISGSWISLQGMIPGIEKIQETLEAPDESVWEGKENITITEGNIEFRDIEFSYSNSMPVLTEFSLKINSGDKIALVGKSGCGKTTLAYMTIGFFRPQKGQIIIDGEDITKFSLRSIRSNIGLIQQDVLVFDGSLRENIMIGNRDATENDLIEACKNAGIWDFIETLPEGIDTMIGVNGIDLSGGQKQRVAIARIYLKNPKIIIFDEATSALDAETEKQIHDSWKNVLSGRTSIVIAHRESSVMLCEKVVLMEDGKVVRTGIPNDMRKNDDKFRELFAVKEEGEDD